MPPAPVNEFFPSDFMEIVKCRALHTNAGSVTPGDIFLAYPTMNLNLHKQPQKVTCSVHCETSIALAFALLHEASVNPVLLEI